QVLLSRADLLAAVRTVAVERQTGRLADVCGEFEGLAAELALHVLPDVLAVNPQLPLAVGTADVESDRFDFRHADNLRQGNELRQINCPWLQITIEQRPAGLTVDQSGGHVVLAIGTRAPIPGRHADLSSVDATGPR